MKTIKNLTIALLLLCGSSSFAETAFKVVSSEVAKQVLSVEDLGGSLQVKMKTPSAADSVLVLREASEINTTDRVLVPDLKISENGSLVMGYKLELRINSLGQSLTVIKSVNSFKLSVESTLESEYILVVTPASQVISTDLVVTK